MATDNFTSTRSTSGPRQTPNTYDLKLVGYEGPVPSVTSDHVSEGGYRMFVSASGERTGMYSITAGQENYRALNRSLIEKGRHR